MHRTPTHKRIRTIGEARRAISAHEQARAKHDAFVDGIGGLATSKQIGALAANKAQYYTFLRLQDKLVITSEKAALAKKAFPELFKK